MSEKRRYKGWLVVNAFLNANKYNELYDWFLEAAKNDKIELIIVTNATLLLSNLEKRVKEEQIDFVLFWDKDIRLAQYLENLSLPVFNNAKAIEICDDKSYTYLTLLKNNIPMPKTILGPKTFEHVDYPTVSFLEQVQEQLGFPLIIKECFGSFGQQVYLIHSREELEEKVRALSPKPILFQQYVASSFGRDIRLQVVGDEVVASMYRYSENGDFRANISNGGKMKLFEPTNRQKEIAVCSCKAIGLDFAGVDLLFGEEEECLVCEVNSNAHFKNIYDCTSVNVADKIIAYIIKNLNRG